MTPEEARRRLDEFGLDAAATDVLYDHFADAEQRGKLGHGFSRIPWLAEQGFDLEARPLKRESDAGVDRWDGNGALGYLTLSAICDDVLAEGVDGARLVWAHDSGSENRELQEYFAGRTFWSLEDRADGIRLVPYMK